MHTAPSRGKLAFVLGLLLVATSGEDGEAFGAKQGVATALQDAAGELQQTVLQLRHDLAAAQQALRANGLPVPIGAAGSKLPRISMLCVFATDHYPLYLNLTLESMRLNGVDGPPVHFNIVNIVDKESQLGSLEAQLRSPVPNVHIHSLTVQQFAAHVTATLGINPDIPDANHLVLKAHDYKPAFAALWAGILEDQAAEYWGWHDLDEVFGRFSSFSRVFSAHDVIGACDGRSCGPFMLFKRGGFDRVFRSCPAYLVKLAARAHDMLDEEGCCGGRGEDHAQHMVSAAWERVHGRPARVQFALLLLEHAWSDSRPDESKVFRSDTACALMCKLLSQCTCLAV
jgi:hypothetical protein